MNQIINNRCNTLKYLIIVYLTLSLLPSLAYSATATYYAKRFSGRRMANGEIYRPYKMVAAHRRYRLGTRLKVTNRRNGKSVIVRVADRCRCSLDLSPRAFRRIGSLRQGRIPVTIKVIRR